MYLDSFSFNRDLLTQRDSHECNSGQLWYVCTANDFEGCCSVDACQVAECPDDSTAAAGAATTSKSSSTKSSSSNSPTTKTSSSDSSTTKTSSSNSPTTTSFSQSTSQTTTSSPSIVHVTITVSQSPSPTANPISTTSAVASSESKSSNTVPIIVGSAAGGVALILLAIMAFCCFRRRQKKKQNSQFIEPTSPAFTFFNPAGKVIQTPSSADTKRRSVLGDVFAPFGGRYHSGTTNPSTPNEPVTVVPTTTTTDTSQQHQDQARPTTSSSSNPLPDPDPEKSGLIPPPESSHPAFHPLPGVATTRPAYRPNEPFTISELNADPIETMPATVQRYQRVPELDAEDGIPSPMSTPVQSHAHAQGHGTGDWRSPPPGVLMPEWKNGAQGHHRRGSLQNVSRGGSSSGGLRGRGNGETTHMLPAPLHIQPYLNQNPQQQQQYPKPDQYSGRSETGGRKGKGKENADGLRRNASTHSIPIGLGLEHSSSSASHSRSQSASSPPQQNQHYNAYTPPDRSYSNLQPHAPDQYRQYQQQPPYPQYPPPPPQALQIRNNSKQYLGGSGQQQQHLQRGNYHAPSASVSSMGSSAAYGRTPDLRRG